MSRTLGFVRRAAVIGAIAPSFALAQQAIDKDYTAKIKEALSDTP